MNSKAKKLEPSRTLKNKYDPTNFFRLNQNIRPTQGAPLC